MPQMHPVLVIVAVLVIPTSTLTVLPSVGLLLHYYHLFYSLCLHAACIGTWRSTGPFKGKTLFSMDVVIIRHQPVAVTVAMQGGHLGAVARTPSSDPECTSLALVPPP